MACRSTFEAMVASDIDDETKFYPPNGRFYLVTHRDRSVGVGGLKQLAPGIGEIQRMYVHRMFAAWVQGACSSSG